MVIKYLKLGVVEIVDEHVVDLFLLFMFLFKFGHLCGEVFVLHFGQLELVGQVEYLLPQED
jgi:hypothetical protein